MRLALTILAAALAVSPTMASAANDARGQDAADAFSELCVSMFVGGKPGADPQRFEVTELDNATRQQSKPEIRATTLWDVRAKSSGASMLVHYEAQGLCVVEVAEADEVAVRDAVAQVANKAASLLKTVAIVQPGSTRPVEGMTATTSSWRLPSAAGDVLIVLTTVPEPKFMIQHVMTASYVR